MPFPWKKVKITRFSQLVSDQIQQRHSKDRGRSSAFVVETGFPTSLVDLFVKNKDRLKRPWRKNNKLHTTTPLSLDDDYDDDKDPSFLLSSCPCPPPPPSPVAASPLYSSARALNDGVVVNGSGGGIDSGDANRVLVAVLGMFLVVVLAFGMKKFLVVGITMSAFLLFFLEYLGKQNTGKAAYIYLSQASLLVKVLYTEYDLYVRKHVCRLLRLCREVKEKLKLMILKVMEVFGMDKGHQEGKIEFLEDLSLPNCAALKNNQDQGMSYSIRLIPIEQPKCFVQEIECEKERIDDNTNSTYFGEERGQLEMDLKKVFLEEEGNRCGNGEVKRRKSCQARIRLKMKELVPKRLKCSRRKGGDVEREGSLVGADNVATWEEENGNPRVSRCISSLSSLSREFDDGKDIIYNLDDCCELLEVEEILNQEEGKTETEQNSGYVVMLLIVLIGLIGGRIVALVLTLTWCLMWKSGKTLRQYIKVPFLRSPAKESS